MSEIDYSDARKRLLHLREELEAVAGFNNESSQVVELDQSRVGRLSRMDALQVQAMAQASGQRRAETLRKIDIALIRIDSNVYGICRACDGEINEKRLEFDPTAMLCIDCAEEAERK
jgi:DnaK suppressor protein